MWCIFIGIFIDIFIEFIAYIHQIFIKLFNTFYEQSFKCFLQFKKPLIPYQKFTAPRQPPRRSIRFPSSYEANFVKVLEGIIKLYAIYTPEVDLIVSSIYDSFK